MLKFAVLMTCCTFVSLQCLFDSLKKKFSVFLIDTLQTVEFKVVFCYVFSVYMMDVMHRVANCFSFKWGTTIFKWGTLKVQNPCK